MRIEYRSEEGDRRLFSGSPVRPWQRSVKRCRRCGEQGAGAIKADRQGDTQVAVAGDLATLTPAEGIVAATARLVRGRRRTC